MDNQLALNIKKKKKPKTIMSRVILGRYVYIYISQVESTRHANILLQVYEYVLCLLNSVAIGMLTLIVFIFPALYTVYTI